MRWKSVVLFCNWKRKVRRLMYLVLLIVLLVYFMLPATILGVIQDALDNYLIPHPVFPNFSYSPEAKCERAPQRCDVTRPVVPNIVHYIWSFVPTRDIKFVYLIGYLSALKNQAPDEMYFWYEEAPPNGPFWNEFLKRAEKFKTKLVFEKLAQPTHIHGKAIRWPQHAADFTRLEILLKHGGIYLDSDVLVLNSLASLMCYEYTAGLESQSRMSNGFIISKSSSKFLNMFYESYRDYRPSMWTYNSVKNHFWLYMENQDLAHVEPYCINYPHNPIMLFGAKGFDWSNHYALHLFNKEVAPYDLNPDNIKYINSPVADMFYYFYYDKPKDASLRNSNFDQPSDFKIYLISKILDIRRYFGRIM